MPRPAFWISSGWLRYFDSYELPCLVKLNEDEVEFVRDSSGDVIKKEPLYRLQWPGEGDTNRDGVPDKIVRKWPEAKAYFAQLEEDRNAQSHHSLKDLLKWDAIPERTPETVAYHLAVNQKMYGPIQYDVCGLPAARVSETLGAVFALDRDYYAAIVYLKQMAETHREHPFFQGFDTSVRDSLHKITQESVWLFFFMLGDCLYNREKKWWARGPKSNWWAHQAAYMHWVGRTGSGLYHSFAKFPRKTDEYMYKRAEVEIPDVLECLTRWSSSGWSEKARGNSHEDGHDPCVAREGGDNLIDAIGKALETGGVAETTIVFEEGKEPVITHTTKPAEPQ